MHRRIELTGATEVRGRAPERRRLLRRVAVAVARNGALRKVAISTPGIRQLAWRFVAGEDLDSGMAAARALNAAGIKATLNCVGTHVRVAEEAVAGADAAIATLRAIERDGLDANLSVKLTRIGLDVDEALCRSQLSRVVESAAEMENFVRIDMEESRYVAATLRLFDEMRRTYGGNRVGIVLQSYLRDRAPYLERAVAERWRVRLVKGGYWEPPGVVYRSKADIDDAFRHDAEVLLTRGEHLALATHDPAAIGNVRRLAARAGLGPRSFELQMLYGVRPQMQHQLAAEGHVVRCYVPYGSEWYEYFLGCVRQLPVGALQRFRAGCATLLRQPPWRRGGGEGAM